MNITAALIILSLVTISPSALTQRNFSLREIYIVPVLGHLDLGFTATQREVEAMWPGFFREGIKFLEKHPEAKLASGCLLPLDWFREDASPEEWQRFVTLVKSGRWELTSGFAHMNTAMMSEAENVRFFLGSRRWEEELGVRIRTWVHEDVPGLAWNMAEAATDSKMEFIVVGANELGGLSPLPDLPRLFRWEAPDGEKITISLHGGNGYLEGGLDLKIHVIDGLEKRLKKFEQDIREDGYKQDFALVLFNSGDNHGAAIFEQLLETVNKWNDKGGKPGLRIATFGEYYKRITKHEGELPVVRGDWPANWEALVQRAPRGQAAVREAHRNIRAIEALSVINNEHDSALIDRIWRNILLHDEHSGTGAWPGMLTREQAIEQNRTEYLYAARAQWVSRILLRETMVSLGSRIRFAAPLKFLFFNYTSHEHDGPFASITMKKRAREVPGIGFRVTSLERGRAEVNDNYSRFFEKVGYLISDQDTFGKAEKIDTRFVSVRDYFIENFIFDIPMMELPSRFSLYAIHESEGNLKVSGYMRNGLWISPDVDLRDRADSYMYPVGAVHLREDGRNVLVSSLVGTPFKLNESKFLSLLYVQEPRAVFKGGEEGYLDPEPEVTSLLQSVYFIDYTNKRYQDDTEMMIKLDQAANPIVGEDVRYGGEGKGSLPHRAVFLDTDDPRAWITELKWAYFGEGVIVRVRNVTHRTVTTRLLSDYWEFTAANLTDALERDFNDAGDTLICRDNLNMRTSCNDENGVQLILRLRPREVVTLRIKIAR